MELRLAIELALKYAGMKKSRQRFEAEGVPVVWPGHERLAEALGCSRQNIGAASKRLAKRGLVQITPGLGRGKSSEYRLEIKGNVASGVLARAKTQYADAEKANSPTHKGKDRQAEKASELVAPLHSFKSRDHTHSQSKISGFGFQDRKDGKTHPDFEEVFEMWPNPDKDHGMAMGAWINNVVKSGTSPEFVRKRARRWCKHWEATGEKRIPALYVSGA